MGRRRDRFSMRGLREMAMNELVSAQGLIELQIQQMRVRQVLQILATMPTKNRQVKEMETMLNQALLAKRSDLIEQRVEDLEILFDIA